MQFIANGLKQNQQCGPQKCFNQLIRWFQFLQCKDFLLLLHCKLNIFGFGAVINKQYVDVTSIFPPTVNRRNNGLIH